MLQYSGVDQSWAGVEAGQAAGRAQASFRLALEEKPHPEGSRAAPLSSLRSPSAIPLLDRNQRADTLASLADSLENAEEAYEARWKTS